MNKNALYCKVEGRGAVILIHGSTLDHSMWDHQALEVSKYFKVIRYDLRGFVKSFKNGDLPIAIGEESGIKNISGSGVFYLPEKIIVT
ncbi:MAG: hypothetical protein GY941_09985 [Planctomycetes bacterium]|nr:hypothetical protein [Planctomycetota bacterium]